jgi:hypothetical protein
MTVIDRVPRPAFSPRTTTKPLMSPSSRSTRATAGWTLSARSSACRPHGASSTLKPAASRRARLSARAASSLSTSRMTGLLRRVPERVRFPTIAQACEARPAVVNRTVLIRVCRCEARKPSVRTIAEDVAATASRALILLFFFLRRVVRIEQRARLVVEASLAPRVRRGARVDRSGRATLVLAPHVDVDDAQTLLDALFDEESPVRLRQAEQPPACPPGARGLIVTPPPRPRDALRRGVDDGALSM